MSNDINAHLSMAVTDLVHAGHIPTLVGSDLIRGLATRPVKYDSFRACYTSTITGKQVDNVQLHLARKSGDPFRVAKILEDILGITLMQPANPALPAAAKRITQGSTRTIIDTTARQIEQNGDL